MKNKWFGVAVRIYEIWSAALFVIFLVMAGHRCIVFCIWQISNILAILLLVLNIAILFQKKRRILKANEELGLLKKRLESEK